MSTRPRLPHRIASYSNLASWPSELAAGDGRFRIAARVRQPKRATITLRPRSCVGARAAKHGGRTGRQHRADRGCVRRQRAAVAGILAVQERAPAGAHIERLICTGIESDRMIGAALDQQPGTEYLRMARSFAARAQRHHRLAERAEITILLPQPPP